MEIEFGGQLKEADLVAAQWVHLRRFRFFGLAFLVVVGTIGVYSLISAVLGFSGWFTPFLFVVLALTLLWSFWSLQRSARRTLRGYLSLQGDQRYRADDVNLHAASPVQSGVSDWSAFVRWRESERLILLYPSDKLYYIIPKRWFQGDQLAAFTSLLRKKLGEQVV